MTSRHDSIVPTREEIHDQLGTDPRVRDAEKLRIDPRSQVAVPCAGCHTVYDGLQHSTWVENDPSGSLLTRVRRWVSDRLTDSDPLDTEGGHVEFECPDCGSHDTGERYVGPHPERYDPTWRRDALDEGRYVER